MILDQKGMYQKILRLLQKARVINEVKQLDDINKILHFTDPKLGKTRFKTCFWVHLIEEGEIEARERSIYDVDDQKSDLPFLWIWEPNEKFSGENSIMGEHFWESSRSLWSINHYTRIIYDKTLF